MIINEHPLMESDFGLISIHTDRISHVKEAGGPLSVTDPIDVSYANRIVKQFPSKVDTYMYLFVPS